MLGLCLCACTEDSRWNLRRWTSKVKEGIAPNPTLVIQPFEGFPESDIQYLVRRLKVDYTGAVEVRKAIPLPKNYFHLLRQRYIADSLLAFLKKRSVKGELLIGLTHRKMGYTKSDTQFLYGIMGLSTMPSDACIVSSNLIYKHGVKQDHLYKVVVHEVGHSNGLPHCPVKTCFLRDANGGNPLREETGFCDSCKRSMNKKGWRFL
ncbi:MAG: Zn-dependent protease [Bacteroidetes bacterium]|nr:Zn-dependent protease [Bacteroidota bacterium]